MKAKKRGRVTPRKEHYLGFVVWGDEFGPLFMLDDQTGEVWAWCVGCEHVTPLDFEVGPREQICPDCLNMLPEGR